MKIKDIRMETYCGYTLSRALFACMNRHNMYFAALLMSGPPVYSGKYRSSGTWGRSQPAAQTRRGACTKVDTHLR